MELYLVLCLPLLATLAQDGTTPVAELNYRIMFTSDVSRAYADIYITDFESDTSALFIREVYARYPTWSFISNQLAFVSSQGEGENIFVMDLDDHIAVNVTNNRAHEQSPRWSPTVDKFAFASDVNGDWDVFVVDSDGSNGVNLTSDYAPANDGMFGLDWSPDGDQIVFTSDRNGRAGIYVTNVDGSQQRLILPNDSPSEDRYPVWSPLEDEIAFVSHRADGYGIYILNLDSSELIFLPPGSIMPPTSHYTHLAWSPDGVHIAFAVCGGRITSCEIYVINVDTYTQVGLTTNDRYDDYPAWISDIDSETIVPIFATGNTTTISPIPDQTADS